MKRDSGMKGRGERSRGTEILIDDTFTKIKPTEPFWKIPLLILGSLITCLYHLVYYFILHVYKGSGERLHYMGGYEYNSLPVILCIFIP